jgi:hypothetical protein
MLLQRDPSLGWISTDDLRNAMQRLPDVTADEAPAKARKKR